MMLAKSIALKQRKRMAALFPNMRASLKLPRLHEIVLDFRHGDLDAEARRPDFNINTQDAEGNTSLQWGSVRGDATTAQWLLA